MIIGLPSPFMVCRIAMQPLFFCVAGRFALPGMPGLLEDDMQRLLTTN
jgi:hypothetical protein